MGAWGELVTAVFGVLVGVVATEGTHYWRARRESPAIRLAVRPGSDHRGYVLSNSGYATAHKVSVSVGWSAPRGRFRPSLHIRQWSEVPAGAELHFAVPEGQTAGEGSVILVTWREGAEPTYHRRMQLWPLK